MDWFFVQDFQPVPIGSIYLLEGDEAHHLARVLRVKPGEKTQLFDGIGNLAAGEVVHVRKTQVEILIEDKQYVPPPALQVRVAVSFPKGDRLHWMMEKLTELGVDRVVPLTCQRSVAEAGAHKRDRLEKQVIAACKQSQRAWLLQIDPPQLLTEFLLKGGDWAMDPGYFLDPAADTPLGVAGRVESRPRTITVFIGPEGGWTDEERQLAQASGVNSARLATPILRIETAAIASATLVKHQIALWKTLDDE